MLNRSLSRAIALSVLIHFSIAGVLLLLRYSGDARHEMHEVTLTVITPDRKSAMTSMRTVRAGGLQAERASYPPNIDLRLSYAKDERFFMHHQTSDHSFAANADGSDPSGITNPDARELLFTETKVLRAFDLLAEKINQFLDYPEILIENGVQGVATLDLYFDKDGNIDEARTKLFGGNRSVRGLLAHASRSGLVKWYRSDADQLKRDQFKNQHFRADFVISHALEDASRLEKTSQGSYTFLRRHYVHKCANPTGVDVACVAMKTYGFIRGNVSKAYKARFQALQDRLEHYDDIGLDGVTAEIRGA